MEFKHIPVMLNECLTALDIKENAPTPPAAIRMTAPITRPAFSNWNSGMKVGGV